MMFPFPTRLKNFALSNLSMAIALSSAALAPSVAIGQIAIEEVIVTARKREESLQETPIAVSALSSDAMEELGIADLADLRDVIPNVDVKSTSYAYIARTVSIL